MEHASIWIGGGAAGRFGTTFMKALGGEPLVIDKDNHLGGKCCKNACVAEIFFYDQAATIDRLRWLQGNMWVPKIDKRVSIQEIAKIFRMGRGSVYDFMHWQSKDQLDLNFILNKDAVRWMLSSVTLGMENSWDKRIKPLLGNSKASLDRKNWKLN